MKGGNSSLNFRVPEPADSKLKGHIAFQEQPAESRVMFRNVKILDL